MNNFWSDFIQTSEELYQSRDLRFNEKNKALCLEAIGVKPYDKVLEIGCAGGVFCHKLKRYVPSIDITGLDFDTSHIEYAKKKSAELGLACNFINGDATSIPFPNASFDLCYSYTVSEHIPHTPFFSEQYRVLKQNGRIAVLSVRTKLGLHYSFPESNEEAALMQKAWVNAQSFLSDHSVAKYEMIEQDFPLELEKAGFRNVKIDILSYVSYAPDNSSVSDTTAHKQINCERLSALCSVQKALKINPDALTEDETQRLIELINKRYDQRIELYDSGKRIWDFSSSSVLVVSGIK